MTKYYRLRFDIYANKNEFGDGDKIIISVKVDNLFDSSIDLYAALVMEDIIYFYPSWQKEPEFSELGFGIWDVKILETPTLNDPPKRVFPFYAVITEHNTLNVIGLDSVAVHPESWKDVRQTFALPPDELSIEFAGFTVLDEQSCSACQSTLLMFLKKYGKQLRQNISEDEDIIIAIGKGHKELPDGALCVGNCAARHRNCRAFLSGCPPVASEILSMFNL